MPKDSIRFDVPATGNLPSGITESSIYYVTYENHTSNQFSVTNIPPIENTFLGNCSLLAIDANNGTMGCESTLNLTAGMKLIEKSAITGVSASGDGTTVTITFPEQRFPPYLIDDPITISSLGSFNGNFQVQTCTTTTITYTDTTTGTDTGGVLSFNGTGDIGNDTVIVRITSATEFTVSSPGGNLTSGTVSFEAMADAVAFVT